MKPTEQITGIILAGGKSTRMGIDKGLMNFQGKPMIKHVIDKLGEHVSTILIITNNNEYACFGLPVTPDLIQNIGPVGGIYTALKIAVTDKILITSCDTPFLSSEVIIRLIKNSDNKEVITLFYNGKKEQFPAIYNKSCLPILEQMINFGEKKLQIINSKIGLNLVDCSDLDPTSFININTQTELKSAKNAV